MPFQKTEKARLLLQSHDGTLGLRERRLLILCNGQRNANELAMLFGGDAGPVLLRLQALGLIAAASPAPTTLAAPANAPPLAQPASAPPPAAAKAATPPPLPGLATGPRRSLVAAKMYMLDMLELQRNPSALEHRRLIQSCRENDETTVAIVAGLRFLPATMGTRVRDRLLEVLPEEHIPTLRRLDS